MTPSTAYVDDMLGIAATAALVSQQRQSEHRMLGTTVKLSLLEEKLRKAEQQRLKFEPRHFDTGAVNCDERSPFRLLHRERERTKQDVTSEPNA